MKKNIKQIIIVRKDILELGDLELNKLSVDRQMQYYKEKEEIGKMGKGKLAAQVAHASMAPLLRKMKNDKKFISKDSQNLKDSDLFFIPPKGSYELKLKIEEESDLKIWLEGSFTKVVVYVKSEEKLLNIHKKLEEAGIASELIKDSGFTVFTKPTYTCLGIEPLSNDKIDPFTKKLRLLD